MYNNIENVRDSNDIYGREMLIASSSKEISVVPYEENKYAVKNKVAILDMKVFEESTKDEDIIKVTLER